MNDLNAIQERIAKLFDELLLASYKVEKACEKNAHDVKPLTAELAKRYRKENDGKNLLKTSAKNILHAVRENIEETVETLKKEQKENLEEATTALDNVTVALQETAQPLAHMANEDDKAREVILANVKEVSQNTKDDFSHAEKKEAVKDKASSKHKADTSKKEGGKKAKNQKGHEKKKKKKK